MELARYKAVLCEGAAEEAIINILLDDHRLIFEREELLEEKPLRIRQAERFETRYLRKGFSDKISIIRILDSKNENFKLSKAYKSKVDVINIVTAPEIEMLIIINEGMYKNFCKSRKKPSDFCKTNLKMVNVKNYQFICDYFSNPNDLIQAIIKYDSIHKNRGEYSLKDLLKN